MRRRTFGARPVLMSWLYVGMSANLLKLSGNNSQGIYRERAFKVNVEEKKVEASLLNYVLLSFLVLFVFCNNCVFIFNCLLLYLSAFSFF